MVEDLNSRNGTYLNHRPLIGLLRLKSGDRIGVGGTVLVFERDPEDSSKEHHDLKRVRFTPDGDSRVARLKPVVETDTTPLSGLDAITREELRNPLIRLRAIYQLSDSLRSELELNDLLWKTMDVIWRLANPNRGVILLSKKGDVNSLEPVLVRNSDDENGEIIISQSIVERCYRERVALLISDTASDKRFEDSSSIRLGAIRSALCTPLVAGGRSFGVIYLDLQDSTYGAAHSFDQDDLDLVSGVAMQAAMAIHIANLHQEGLRLQSMEKELEIARRIQNNLLPREIPTLPGVDLSAVCVAARQVGGDYYDCIELPDGRFVIVVCDALGKGVQAAIMVAHVRSALRAQLRIEHQSSSDVIVESLNRSLCFDGLPEDLVSVFLAIYDPQTRNLKYVTAGHVPGLLIRDTGAVERLASGGCLMGIDPEFTYPYKECQLEANDVLLLYTDGITELANLAGEFYGEDRLSQTLSDCRQFDAASILGVIHQDVMRFKESTEPRDDMTLLVMKLMSL